MPGLLDIAPPEPERINIRGTDLEVRGIRNRDWASLLRRFPKLREKMNGASATAEESLGDMLADMSEFMPAVIAAGLGNTSDEKTEALVEERLTDAEQVTVFNTIMRLTNPPPPLPGGPAAAGQSDSGQDATTSPRPSSN